MERKLNLLKTLITIVIMLTVAQGYIKAQTTFVDDGLRYVTTTTTSGVDAILIGVVPGTPITTPLIINDATETTAVGPAVHRVIAIGSGALSNNTQLQELVIGANVKTIEGGAINNCSNLTSVTIGENVEIIGRNNFSFCESLGGIFIPNSVKSIGDSSFVGNTSLMYFEVYSDHPYYSTDGKALYNKDKTTLLAYAAGVSGKEFQVPSTVEIISESAFTKSKQLAVLYIDSINIIGISRSAVKDCPALEMIFLPSSVDGIGSEAFANCPNLRAIFSAIPPDRLSSFEPNIFQGSNPTSGSLQTIYVPKGAKNAYQNAPEWNAFDSYIEVFIFDVYDYDLAVGESKELKISSDVSADISNKGYTFTIEDPSIVSVTPMGMGKFNVTGKAKGETNIIIKSKVCGYTDTCRVRSGPKKVYVRLEPYGTFTKEYDGTNKADFNESKVSYEVFTDASFSSTSLISGVKIVSAEGTYDNKNVGTGKTITFKNFVFAEPDKYYTDAEATISGDITAKQINVIPDNITKVYGEADPRLTYKSDPEPFPGDEFTGSLRRAPGEDVGVYPIRNGTLDLGENYQINFSDDSELTITKATQTITWDQSIFIGCEDDETITLEASSSSGLGISYESSDKSVAKIRGNKLYVISKGDATITATQEGNKNYFPAEPIVKKLGQGLRFLVSKMWSDVLAFDNTSNNYVKWQWYKNGEKVEGENKQYYGGKGEALNGVYYVEVTDKNGKVISTCPVEISSSVTLAGISASPNPVKRGGTLKIKSNYEASQMAGAQLSIISLQGNIVKTVPMPTPNMDIIVPNQMGLYTIKLVLSNGEKSTFNIIVE